MVAYRTIMVLILAAIGSLAADLATHAATPICGPNNQVDNPPQNCRNEQFGNCVNSTIDQDNQTSSCQPIRVLKALTPRSFFCVTVPLTPPRIPTICQDVLDAKGKPIKEDCAQYKICSLVIESGPLGDVATGCEDGSAIQYVYTNKRVGVKCMPGG